MAITAKPQASKVIRLQVLRPIRINDEPVEVGTVIEVEGRSFANELITAGKVRIADEAPAEDPPGKPAKGAKA